ncbi:DUF5675 family protein [Undibacterium sp. Ji49W]|uniref:DUF5675 family protein n=1 Tax=Undibacterium sp. Ji49W TaxID=3413040 RepID=UPI003BF055A9
MKIVVDRFISDDETTISHITVDGRFVCFGLEDEYRVTKLVNETRIPAGTYKVKLRTDGKHNEQYKVLFPDIHRGMLHIQNVPGFEYILIHCGNTQADTSGCLLVGTSAVTDKHNMSIGASRPAYKRLYPIVVDAAAKDTLEIQLIDNDR